MGTDIDGVRVAARHIVRNERGHLLEVARDDDGWVGLGQVYVTASRPGVVKAWYRHHRQVDSVTIAAGAARLALVDDREDSPTRGGLQVVELDATAPDRVLIPPMVWHGYAAHAPGDALIVHVNSTAWSEAHTDEDRRDVDHPDMPHPWV